MLEKSVKPGNIVCQILRFLRTQSCQTCDDIVKSEQVIVLGKFSSILKVLTNKVRMKDGYDIIIPVSKSTEPIEHIGNLRFSPVLKEDSFFVLQNDLFSHLLQQIRVVALASCPPQKQGAARQDIKSVSEYNKVSCRQLLDNLGNVGHGFFRNEVWKHEDKTW